MLRCLVVSFFLLRCSYIFSTALTRGTQVHKRMCGSPAGCILYELLTELHPLKYLEQDKLSKGSMFAALVCFILFHVSPAVIWLPSPDLMLYVFLCSYILSIHRNIAGSILEARCLVELRSLKSTGELGPSTIIPPFHPSLPILPSTFLSLFSRMAIFFECSRPLEAMF